MGTALDLRRLLVGVLFAGVISLIVSAPAVAAAEQRTWTDRRGRTINKAEFVRIVRDVVVLKRFNRIVKVPFSQLSDDDQEYIRRELKSRGQEELIPQATKTNTGPRRGGVPGDPGEAAPGVPRDPGAVPPGTAPGDPGIGPADPGAAPPPNPAGGTDPASVPPGVGPPGADPGGRIPPGGVPGPGIAPPNPGGIGPGIPPGAGIPPSVGGRSDPGIAPGGGIPGGSSFPPGAGIPPGTGIPGGSTFPPGADPGNIGGPGGTSGSRFGRSNFGTPPFSSPGIPSTPTIPAVPGGFGGGMTQKTCSGCGKTVSSSSKAGQKCPHCGVYWSFEEDQHGRTTSSAPRRWAWGGGLGGFLAVCVIIAIRLFARR